MTGLAKLRRQFAAYGTRGVIVTGNFVVMIALATLLKPGEYGQLAYLWSIAQVLAAVGSIGVPGYLLRELSLRSNRKAELPPISAWLVPLVTLVLPAVVIAIGAVLFVALHGSIAASGGVTIEPEQIWLIAVVAWLLNVVNNLVNFPRISGSISLPMAMRDAMPHCLLLAAAVIALEWGSRSSTGIYEIFVVLIAGFILLWLALIAHSHRGALALMSLRTPMSRPDLLGFWGLSIVTVLGANIDILVGGLFLGASELGYYQLIKRIVNVASLPQIVVNWAVVVPVGRAFAERDFSGIQAAVTRASRMAILPLLLLSVLVPIAAVTSSILTGYGFDDAAAWMLAILLLGAVLNVLFGANFSVAAQCDMEYQALVARLGSLLLFCGSVWVCASWTRTGVMLAFCQLLMVLVSNFWLWYAIWGKIGVDSSAASIVLKNGKKGVGSL